MVFVCTTSVRNSSTTKRKLRFSSNTSFRCLTQPASYATCLRPQRRAMIQGSYRTVLISNVIMYTGETGQRSLGPQVPSSRRSELQKEQIPNNVVKSDTEKPNKELKAALPKKLPALVDNNLHASNTAPGRNAPTPGSTRRSLKQEPGMPPQTMLEINKKTVRRVRMLTEVVKPKQSTILSQ